MKSMEQVQELIRTAPQTGVRYLIHQNTIWEAKNGWQPRYYGGKFANGKSKDDHANHIHVNF
jgi:hypothetical protein